MIDYSFIRLKCDFNDAKNINDRSVTEIFYYDFIQIDPFESYLQITNVLDGISFDGDYKVEIIDCHNNTLKDITDKVFIREFTGVGGKTQIKFEIVNIGEDFYRETVYFKFSSTISNATYYSNPLNVTSYQKEGTTYFKYKNYDNYKGIAYTNAQAYQSIRLRTHFDIPIDDSDIESYYQISKNKEISARVLDKQYEKYQLDYIHRFGYDRLNALLKSDVVYVDDVRVTNKTKVDSNDMLEMSNVFNTSFTIAKNYNDISSYENQIFEGLNYVNFTPFNNYTLSKLPSVIKVSFNYSISILQGTIDLFNKTTNTLIKSFNETDMYLLNSSTLAIDSLDNYITTNGDYFFRVSGNLIEDTLYGLPNSEILDSDTWYFSVKNADFSSTDFNNEDFYTD